MKLGIEDIAKIETEYKKLEDEFNLLDTKRRDTQVILRSSEERKNILSTEVTELEEKIKNQNLKLSEIEENHTKILRQINTKEVDRRQLSIDVSQLSEQVAELKLLVENLTGSRERLDQIVYDLSERENQLRDSIIQKEEKILLLQNSIAELENKRESSNTEYNKTEILLSRIKSDFEAEKSKIEKDIISLKIARDTINVDEVKTKYEKKTQEMQAQFELDQALERNKIKNLVEERLALVSAIEEKKREAELFEKKQNKLIIEENDRLTNARDEVNSLKEEIERLKAIRIRLSIEK